MTEVFYATHIAKAESLIPVTGQATVLNTGANLNFTTNNANVKISDTTGNFSGYAWSDDAGWMAFGTADNADGPVNLNFSTGAITGKAKILDTGDLVDFNAAPYGSNVVIDATGNFSGYAWSVSLGWLNFTGVLTTGSSLKPAAPSGFYGTASSTLQIIWNWVDNALTENKYEVQDAAHTDLVDLAANIISWIEPGLLANTPYNRHSAAFNHFGSLDSNADTKYTLIEPIAGITWGTIANNSIQLSPTNTPSNLALGTSGIQYCNTTTATCSAWQQTVNQWTSNGLNPNLQYTFTIQSRNGDGTTTTAFNGPGNTKYTLANPPLAPTLSAGTQPQTEIGVVVNTNANPASTTYVIYDSTDAKYVQADGSLGAVAIWQDAANWNPAGAPQNVIGLTCNTNYTFRTQAKNGDNVLVPTLIGDGAPSSLTTGPCTPAAPTIGVGTALSTTSIRWNFIDNASSETGFRVHDNAHTVMATCPGADLSSCNEIGLTANTQYTRHIHAYNGISESLGSGNDTKYTLASDPGPLTATALSSSSIKLDWLSGGAQNSFNIYRDGVSGVGLLIHSANDLTYTDNGLAASSIHTYYLYALNGDNLETTNFSTATATTLAGGTPSGGGTGKPKPPLSPTPTVSPSPSPSPNPTNVETEIPYIPETVVVNEPTTFRWGGLHFDWSWLKLPDIHLPTINLSWLHWPRLPRIAFPTIHLPSIPRISFHMPRALPQLVWDFGDGVTAVSNVAKHTYSQVGVYIAKLKVTAENGNQQEITKKVTVIPPAPEITNISAQGDGLLIKGKAYPKSLVYLTIHSDPFTVKTQADKKGFFSYLFKEPEKDIPAGEHQISAKAVVYTLDKKEIAGAFSKNYDFMINYAGQFSVTTQQLRLWQIIGLIFGLMTLVLITKYIILPKIKSKKGVS